MRARLLLIPALTFAATRAQAYDFMTVEQARAKLFPRAHFTDVHFSLTDAEINTVSNAAPGATIWRRQVPVWKASTGGWLFLDQVLGRDDHITYMLGLDESSTVIGIEVLVCGGNYDQIRTPEWRAGFVGCRRGGTDPSQRVPLISGVTLSSEHVIDGVRRLLATHAVIMARKAA